MVVRLAERSDVSVIQVFIRENWRSDHIFVTDLDFFLYEMCPFGHPNFALAFDDDRLIGILGFTCSQDTIRESDLWLVMFRTLKIENAGNVGVGLLAFVKSLTDRGVHTVGANSRVLTYYKFLGFSTGWLKHFYWMARDEQSRKFFGAVNSIPSSRSIKQCDDMPYRYWRELALDVCNSTDLDLVWSEQVGLPKTRGFLERRYLNHPKYQYKVFGCVENIGIGVVRPVSLSGFIIWRVVDWVGPASGFYSFCRGLIDLAEENGVAVVDVYASGVAVDKVAQAGFSLLENDSDVVIPNYFEPLVMRNIAISYVTDRSDEPFFMRGDGDQDRPSV